MTTYYEGTTQSGATLLRSSTRTDFTHAAVPTGLPKGSIVRADQSTWSTSAATALASASRNWGIAPGSVEIVAVRVITGAEYRQALKGGAAK